jgi:hypothetical protein
VVNLTLIQTSSCVTLWDHRDRAETATTAMTARIGTITKDSRRRGVLENTSRRAGFVHFQRDSNETDGDESLEWITYFNT